MTDTETQHGDPTQRIAVLEKELADIKRGLWGAVPPSTVISIDSRIENLKRDLSSRVDQQSDPVVSTGPELGEEFVDPPITEIEWGLLTSTPTASSPTVELQPCDQDGTEYTDADPVTVYVKNDGSDADIHNRDWTTETFLSFVRFPWDDTLGVSGVLIGEGGDGGSGQAKSSTYSFVAHYAGYGSVGEPSNIAFYTVPGCRNSFLEIGLDVRECTEWYSPTGTHPAYVKPATSGGPLSQVAWGNPIASWDGDDDEYILLAYTARDSDGLPLGHGVNALPGYNIRARIQADGTLELSTLDATNNSHALVIAGFVRRVVHPRIEVGTQIEFGHLEACVGDHEDNGYEWDSVWGDGVWEPYVAP